MADWLLHIGIPETDLLRRVLTDARAALAKSLTAGDGSEIAFGSEMTVPRAVDLGAGKRAMKVSIKDGRVSLIAPATGGRRQDRFTLNGPTAVGATASRAGIIQTLEHWQRHIDVAAERAPQPGAEEVQFDLSNLLHGAADRFDPSWERANLHAHRPGQHMITIWLRARNRGDSISFGSDASTGCDHRMSRAYVAALDAAIGGYEHVTEWHVRGPGDMPGISLGSPPAVRLSKSGDPMVTMRGLASLPDGPCLIENG